MGSAASWQTWFQGNSSLVFCGLKFRERLWGMGVVFWDCFSSLCQAVYCAGCTFSQDELTNTPSEATLMYTQTSLGVRPSTLAGPFCSEVLQSWQRGAAEWASAGLVLMNDANTGLRSNAQANRGDVSPSNRWQSPFSRAPRAAPALGAGEWGTIKVAQG